MKSKKSMSGIVDINEFDQRNDFEIFSPDVHRPAHGKLTKIFTFLLRVHQSTNNPILFAIEMQTTLLTIWKIKECRRSLSKYDWVLRRNTRRCVAICFWIFCCWNANRIKFKSESPNACLIFFPFGLFLSSVAFCLFEMSTFHCMVAVLKSQEIRRWKCSGADGKMGQN